MHVHRARASRGARRRHVRVRARGRPSGGGGALTLEARPATADESARWDELVEATGRPHLLQTAGWAEIKAPDGWTARRFVFGDDGVCQVLVRVLPLGLAFAYAPRGPLVANADVPDAIAGLRRALGGTRCTALLCDPEVRQEHGIHDHLSSVGVDISPIHVQPRRTLLLDLAQDDATLLEAMRRKTRQYIRKAERAGVVTEETDDVARFHAVLRRVASRDRFGIHEPAYFARLRAAFGDRAHFQMARVGGADVGALLVVRIGPRAWELFGGWSGDHAEDRPFYLLKWRSIVGMRRLGVTRYDMWGLADGDEALAGVENFKLGFGGEVVEWVGALETPVDRALYPLWVIAGRRRLARGA